MRILMVSPQWPPDAQGGAEAFAGQLAKEIRELGYEVLIATETGIDGLQSVHLHRSASKIFRKLWADYVHLRNLASLRDALVALRPDVVHFHNIYGISSALISLSAKMVPTIVTVHDYWPVCYRSTLFRNGWRCEAKCLSCLPSRLLRQVQLRHVVLVSPSRFLGGALRQSGFANVEIIPNAVERFERARDSRRVFFAGRLIPDKGILALLDALRETAVTVDVYGKGHLITALRRTYSEQRTIRIHGWIRSIEDEYRKGGIFVLPSLWPENCPMSVLTAMSHGLPIVASPFGGLPELIEHERTGLITNPERPQDLRESITRLQDDGALRRSLGRAARNKAHTDYSWDLAVRAYLQLYERLYDGNVPK